jgi:hypothetical protein
LDQRTVPVRRYRTCSSRPISRGDFWGFLYCATLLRAVTSIPGIDASFVPHFVGDTVGEVLVFGGALVLEGQDRDPLHLRRGGMIPTP